MACQVQPYLVHDEHQQAALGLHSEHGCFGLPPFLPQDCQLCFPQSAGWWLSQGTRHQC